MFCCTLKADIEHQHQHKSNVWPKAIITHIFNHLSHLTSESSRSLELTILKPVLLHPSGSGSSNVTNSGEVGGRRSMVAFAEVEEANKTSRVVNKVLVSRVTLLAT